MKKFALLLPLFLILCSCIKNNGLSSSSSENSQQLTSSPYRNSLCLKDENGDDIPFFGADPDIIKGDDGYYYLYTSEQYVNVPKRGRMLDRCPTYRSRDMVNWTYCSSVFLDQAVDLNSFCYPDVGIWAPSINYFNGQYYCYYSIGYGWTAGDNHLEYCGIGLATSLNPYGPWTHYGKLFDSKECGVPVSIDPFAFQKEDGKIYLFWGSYNGIYAVEMTIDGLEVIDLEKKIEIVDPTPSLSESYEGIYIFKKDDTYYFSGSRNGFGGGLHSRYDVASGYASSLLGPYKDSTGHDLFGGGDLVIEGDFEDEYGLRGTGHHAIIQDEIGDYWIIYHCYDPRCPVANERTICIDKLIFEDNHTFHTENYVGSNTVKNGPKVEVYAHE
ncbi:MAG: family 43 glycosylhydrolase [Bacilli bacterium]|jgi:arabinan endo-1,5-alpha-L-arabinosidase